MMRQAAAAALVGVLFASLVSAAEMTPAERVRALLQLQDRVAHGDAAAYAEQSKATRELASELRHADADAWKETRNARAALLYVLSGGDPDVLRPLVGLGLAADLDGPLARGVLAFGQNERAEAQRLLEAIDPLLLEPALGAAIALARASLVLESDRAAAMRLLDTARLLAPGGRIEEAALRRLALLAMGGNEIVRATANAGRYFRRFPRSVYAPPFRQSFAAAFAAREGDASEANFGLFATALRALRAEQQVETFTALAREALRRGHLALASMAATTALGAGSHDGIARASLYAAAVDAGSERAAQALSALQAVAREGLDADEARLLDAARETAQDVLRAASDGDPPRETATEPAPAASLPEETSALLQRIAHALGRADELLTETKP
jgi:chemotaxis protein MotC